MGLGRGRCGSRRRGGRGGSRRSPWVRRAGRGAGRSGRRGRCPWCGRRPRAHSVSWLGEPERARGGCVPSGGGRLTGGARGSAGPGREVPDRWEHGHVQAALGDQDLRGVRLDAGDRAQQLDDLGVRGEHELDPLAQVLQRRVERVDVREQLRDHDPVVLDLEAALAAPRGAAGSSRASCPWRARRAARDR